MVVEYMEEGRARRERVERAGKILVYNAYSIKETLKSYGYRWDGIAKAWYKELGEHAEGDIARLEDLIAGIGQNITYELKDPVRFDTPPDLPKSYCFHEFTEEERKALLSGEEIHLDKCWSRKQALFFSCYLSWNGEELVSRYGD